MGLSGFKDGSSTWLAEGANVLILGGTPPTNLQFLNFPSKLIGSTCPYLANFPHPISYTHIPHPSCGNTKHLQPTLSPYPVNYPFWRTSVKPLASSSRKNHYKPWRDLHWTILTRHTTTLLSSSVHKYVEATESNPCEETVPPRCSPTHPRMVVGRHR